MIAFSFSRGPADGAMVASDRLGSGFLARPAGFGGNGCLAGLPESQMPHAGTTGEGADAAHVFRLFVEQRRFQRPWFGLFPPDIHGSSDAHKSNFTSRATADVS